MKKIFGILFALVLVLSFSLIPAVPALADTINVSPGESIQAAIDAAKDGDTVLVSPGTYVENINFKGKAITVKSTSGPSVTTIDGGNSGTVVTFNSGEGPSSVIEGFTITSGNATNSEPSGSAGGGILCDGTSPTIKYNIITGNTAENTHDEGDYKAGGSAGGGIACNNAQPNIANNLITNNEAISPGAGGSGGGILCAYYSEVSITNNVIEDNTASSAAAGGGIAVTNHSRGSIINNIIRDNFATHVTTGGGILCAYDSHPTIEGNIITYNEAFNDNKWSEAGGGIDCRKNSHPVITNNMIAYNSAEIADDPRFGGLQFGQGAGGIVDRWDSYPTIESNTIVFNSVEGGGGKAGGIWDSWWRISVHNSIVWGNTGGADIEIGGQIAEPWRPFPPSYVPGVTHCDFASGYYRIHHRPVPITNGMDGYTIGNINANPLFVDAVGGDLHLQLGSPCIDAGTNVSAPATDLEGQERPYDGDGDGEAITDMGCYESNPLLPMASFVIDHAKIDFKKKVDDDKVRVQGKLELDLDNGDGVNISEDVIVTVGPLSETIPGGTMEEKGKKGEKWQYKRPKDGIGNIKKMTINWKNGKFDIRMDKAELTGMTDPEVTISIQIGDDGGEETIPMREKKHHWDYKAK